MRGPTTFLVIHYQKLITYFSYCSCFCSLRQKINLTSFSPFWALHKCVLLLEYVSFT